jgi:hypothetical protein
MDMLQAHIEAKGLDTSDPEALLFTSPVAKLGEAAAEAMGARYLVQAPRDGRAMASSPDGEPG